MLISYLDSPFKFLYWEAVFLEVFVDGLVESFWHFGLSV